MKETGGVLTVKTQLGEDGQLLVSVSDTGVGLPREKIEQIFDAYDFVYLDQFTLWKVFFVQRPQTLDNFGRTAAVIHDSYCGGGCLFYLNYAQNPA